MLTKKMIFINNYLNPHVISMCDELFAYYKNDFMSLEYSKVNSERKKMDWSSIERPYKHMYYEHLNDVLEADTVIFGGIIDKTIGKRIRAGKNTFLMTERPYKVPTTKRNYIRRRIGAYIHFNRYQCDNLFLLCMGSHVVEDMQSFGNFKDRMFQWGYFPTFQKYAQSDLVRDNDCIHILWASRMIPLKHPEIVLHIAKRLKNQNVPVIVEMIGGGEILDDVKKLDRDIGCGIQFTGELPFSEVRKKMHQSDIFLFTSDRNEGWGAVVNEAMNEGCAVISSEYPGAAGCLISNGKNGFVFTNEEELFGIITKVINETALRKTLSRNAYQTIEQEWNAKTAVQRLIDTIEDNFTSNYISGPMKRIG